MSKTTTSSPATKETSIRNSYKGKNGADLRPERGVDYVKGFQVLLVLVFENVVDFAHPRHGRVIVTLRQRVEVQYNVISFD